MSESAETDAETDENELQPGETEDSAPAKPTDGGQVSEAGGAFSDTETVAGGADATDKSTGTAPHEAGEK